MPDFILNGRAHGDVAQMVVDNREQPGHMRPFINSKGQSCVMHQTPEGKFVPMVVNAPATLRKDEWIALDRVVLTAARQRLRVVNRLREAGLQITIPGYGRSIFEYQTVSEMGEASVSMSGIQRGETDRPVFELEGMPLPIQHMEYEFTDREIAISRNTGTPLDTIGAEQASRRVAESIESMALGTSAAYKYGGYYVYGLRTFPERMTYTITGPTLPAWTPNTLLTEILQAVQMSVNNRFYGPWMMIASTNWMQFLNRDYIENEVSKTLRQRILDIEGVDEIVMSDYLPDYDVLLVQKTNDVIRMVIGMDISNVQWEEMGGKIKKFQVMSIIVPQVRKEFYDRTGVVHMSVSVASTTTTTTTTTTTGA